MNMLSSVVHNEMEIERQEETLDYIYHAFIHHRRMICSPDDPCYTHSAVSDLAENL